MPTNLFANAKQTTKPAAAKKQKLQAQLDAKYAAKIKRVNELRSSVESLKAELSGLEGELKTVGKGIFLDLYKKMQSKPDNFNMVSGLEKIMFILQDKYLKVTDEKLATLKQFFGVTEIDGKGVDKKNVDQYNSIFDMQATYSFNTTTIDKPGVAKAVSDAIMNSKKISDEDKQNLLVVTNEVTIKKGTINHLLTYQNFEQLFELIEPVTQLKEVGEKD